MNNKIKKNGKYLRGASYSTLRGYTFSWTFDVEKAFKMTENQFDYYLAITKGKACKL